MGRCKLSVSYDLLEYIFGLPFPLKTVFVDPRREVIEFIMSGGDNAGCGAECPEIDVDLFVYGSPSIPIVPPDMTKEAIRLMEEEQMAVYRDALHYQELADAGRLDANGEEIVGED